MIERNQIDDLIRAETCRYCDRVDVPPSDVWHIQLVIRLRLCLEEMRPVADLKYKIISDYLTRVRSSNIFDPLPQSLKDAIQPFDEMMEAIRKKYYRTDDA